MVDWTQISGVVDGIYGACVDGASWPEALRRSLELIGGRCAVLYWTDPRRGVPHMQCNAGADPAVCSLCLAHYLQFEPRLAQPSALSERCLGLCSGAELVIAVIEQAEDHRASLLVHRDECHGPVDGTARQVLDVLVPHLRRALRIARTLESAHRTPDLNERARSAARYFRLTPAEGRVVQALVGGATLGGIARRLGISEATVKTHLQHVFDKTGTRRQVDLVARLVEHDQ